MARIVLSEIDLNSSLLGEDVQIEKINKKTLERYTGNNDVIAIVGCRATANEVLKMEFPSLKIYQLTSAGFDGIDVHAFVERNIWLCNAGDVYSTPIAETVIYGMLQYAKRYWKNPKWHWFRPARGYKYIEELAEKNLLIMGCGRIGNAVAKRASAFDMNVYGYNHNCHEKPGFIEVYATRDELISDLNQFDYIVTTLPLNDETQGFIDSELFKAMNRDAVIINVGRKGIFNEKDFYTALKTNTIRGGVLDMFEKIPNPVTNPFRKLKNTIVLPGVSAISIQVNSRLIEHVSNNVKRVLNEIEPQCIVKC